ncbi:MAG: hypothetical protein ACKVS8_13315 [Phycisphaerales bacterium]
MSTSTHSTPISRRFPCAKCGAELDFVPGTDTLVCTHCGHSNAIAAAGAPVEELDFAAHLDRAEAHEAHIEAATVKCQSCAAAVTRPKDVAAFACPFCGTNIIAQSRSESILRPRGLLPFKVKHDDARERFRAWVKSRWFAPSSLSTQSFVDAAIKGVYLPYWTYDTLTTAPYTGERGDAYYVPVPMTVMVNGKPQVRMTMQRRIRWSSVRGSVENAFDDLLVPASRSLPTDKARVLEPWDLGSVVPYADEYVSGFIAETYQVDLKQGFGVAEAMMKPVIESTIRGDIGGDEQRIGTYRVAYRGITFKHLLLPVWMSAYRHMNTVYHFYVNARTGEVTGDRPWSYWKITGAVLAGLALAGLIAAVIALSQR